MKTEFRIYAALGVLALAGGGFYLSQKQQAETQAARSVSSATANLPTISLTQEQIDQLTKLELTNADKTSVTLEKKGDSWEVTAPVAAKANAANVQSLLENLKELKAKESIDRGEALYAQYDLNDEKGVHLTAFKGADKALELYFGKSGSRGQMARAVGSPGVFIATGYSSYLYAREVKNWRETSILKFEDENAIGVEVQNKNGAFSFSKNGETWSASFKKRLANGALAAAADPKWQGFDEAKVKDLLRAFKALNAEDFAEAGADTGLAEAEKEGGVVRIQLKDGAGELVMKVGKAAKGTSRYAEKVGGDGTIYTLSSWAAEWATADKAKFEKGADPAPGEGAPLGFDGHDEHDGHGH